MSIQILLILLSITPSNLVAQNLIDANTLSNPPFNSNFKVGMTIRNYEKSKGLWENLYAIQINNKWGVMNANWILLTPIIFDDVSYFNSGVAEVTYNGKVGLIDKTGIIKIQPKYEKLNSFIKCPVKDDMLRFHSPNDCNKTFYRIADKWGIIDQNGNEITPAIYSYVPMNFTQSVAVVQKNNKWGMIDSFGNVIVPCIYKEEISYLHHGYNAIAFIDDSGKTGIFNIKGEIIVPFSNQTLANFYSDLGANSSGDEVPPVFKVNGKLTLAKNITRLEPDYGLQLDPSTLDVKNQNSFIYKYYHSLKTQNSNNLTASNASTSTSKSTLLEGNSTNKQSNNSSSSSSSSNEFAVAILLGMLESSSGSSNNSSSSFTDRTPSQSGSSSSSSEVCSYCKPKDSKGHYIQDFDINSRTYKNGRYVLRPGHKPCDICFGTGRCRESNWSNAPGICDENYTCKRCEGDRFIVCKDCRGSGFRGK